MKYVFCLFIFLPLYIYGQNTSERVVYTKIFEIKDSSCTRDIERTFDYIKNNRAIFFRIRSYTKDLLDKAIDTGYYGMPIKEGNRLKTKCEWVYKGNKKKGTVLLRGDIVFNCQGHLVTMELQQLQYYKYFDENGKMTLKNEGRYEDLDMCKYCNASGMKIGEFVHDNFLHIAASYGRYIK